MRAPISKVHFVSIINAIDVNRRRDSTFSAVLTEYLNYHTVVCSCDDFTEAVIEYVEASLCCCGWVHYFVYETNFGQKKPPKGKHYFPDAGALYDYLVSKLNK